MSVNKNFVVKNGLEVSSGLIFADATAKNVGIGSTSPKNKLDVAGGIGATNLSVTGVGTILNFRSTTGIVTNLTVTNLSVGVGTFGTLSGNNINYNSATFPNATITNLTGTNLSFTGIGTINGVKITSGIITSTNPGVTTVVYYGDGSGLTNLPPGREPEGSNTQVQYNDNGVFGASPNFTFNGNSVYLSGILTTGSAIVGAAVTISSTGIRVAGVVTATSAVVGTAVTINSSGINVIGVVTAISAVVGTAVTINSSGIRVAGVVTATSAVIVGSSATVNGSGINVIGVVTATSAVVGTAVTINSSGIRVAGVVTATSAVVGTAVTINSSGIRVAGVVTATDFDSLSDINYKDNINTVRGALLKVEQMRGVKFDWKQSGLPSYGVIAQELQEVLPELVHGEDPKTVNYNGIIGVLIEAIKELKNEVDNLKN